MVREVPRILCSVFDIGDQMLMPLTNVGMMLGESNYPCSRKDQADTDLALIFKYTHFT